jgi:hypothetical protein
LAITGILWQFLAFLALVTKFNVKEYNNLGNPLQPFMVFSANFDQGVVQINFHNL